MKLRKVLLLTAATAALGSMNVTSAFADARKVRKRYMLASSAFGVTSAVASYSESSRCDRVQTLPGRRMSADRSWLSRLGRGVL